jgi:hypothetical protein
MTINRRSILLRNANLIVTDGVKASVSIVKRGSVPALKLDYEFSGAGYATVRLPVSIDLPGNFAFRFQAWGAGPRNTLEFKVLDASTDNVWWVHRANHAFSSTPCRLSTSGATFGMPGDRSESCLVMLLLLTLLSLPPQVVRARFTLASSSLKNCPSLLPPLHQ